MSLAIFFSFYGKVSGADLTHASQIRPCLELSISRQPHDAFSASYANRILFLRDGVIFTEILKGRDTRKVFFDKILNVLTMMGGGVSDVL